MTRATRDRLARLLREPWPDVAEAALLVCAEVEPELDVGGELLRLDAFADQLVVKGVRAEDGTEVVAAELAGHLGGELGFRGDEDTYHDPANGLLTRVLDRRRGLPITLSIIWSAVAQRLGVLSFGIGLPGHFVTGLGTPDDLVVVDPFHGGQRMDHDALEERVRTMTAGQGRFHPAMLRPTPAPAVIRRLLNNLTRDFLFQGDVDDALWTVELKQLIPGSTPDHDRQRGELLVQLGRYRDAAHAFDDYVEHAEDAPDRDEVAALARRARAKTN